MMTKTVQAHRSKQVKHSNPNGSGQSAPDHDPFRYGWRTVAETLPDGKIGCRDIPLTQADFLNPQLGDHMVQSDHHFMLIASLYQRFHKRYLNQPTVGIFSDLKMLWGIPGLAEPAPDLAIIPHLQSKPAYHSSFDVVKEQTRPCLLVEVVSPHYPGDDTIKVQLYQRVGITEYIIINPHFNDESTPLELLGYRLVDGVYQEIEPDRQGRLLSETTGVWFGVDESRRSIVLEDASTGERLLTDEEEYEARLEAEARIQTAEVEIARLKTLLAAKNNRGE